MTAVPSRPPPTRYAETNTGHLAYQTFGSGDRDIIFLTGALTNLDAIWDEPSAVRFLDRLGSMGRVIFYDMRGSGVSDPILDRSKWLPIEALADDVRAVLDAVGSEQAVVYGDTEGGFSAMMPAAVDPQRVSALVLVNAYPRLLRADDYPIGAPQAVADALAHMYAAQHGTTGAMLEMTAPSAAGDLRFRTWWTRYQRSSVPLGLARSTFEWFGEVDVRAALPLIHAPTLVVSRRDARFRRLQYGEYLASLIEGAALRVVEGADTVPFMPGTSNPPSNKWRSFSPESTTSLGRTASWQPFSSPTSSDRRHWPHPWVTSGGSTCSRSTIGSFALNSADSGVARSR
jgi:pimeloyl-ACP methyl ester carboxylesterase